MKILLTHPKTQHSYKIAKILYDNDLLYKFFTSYVITEKNCEFFPDFIKKVIANRIINIPSSFIRKNYLIELEREIVNKVLKLNYFENYFRINYSFQKNISDDIIKACDAVIGFDSTSWDLGIRSKRFNKIFILDRTIGHPVMEQRIYADLAKKYPSWSKEYLLSKSDKHIALENAEHQNADIITVGGQFVKNNLLELGISENKIFVNPYGVELKHFTPKKQVLEGKIKFLFFGSVIARKGVPTLLSAWEKLNTKDAELYLAGYGSLPEHVTLPNNVKILGKIVPSMRKSLFDSMHVMVFPSVFEGFGQVLTEAAASGLPIISTYNTGGIEIIEEGVNGFLVNAGDKDALADRINFFIKNPECISPMGLKKVEYIKREFSLEAYESRWLDIIKRVS